MFCIKLFEHIFCLDLIINTYGSKILINQWLITIVQWSIVLKCISTIFKKHVCGIPSIIFIFYLFSNFIQLKSFNLARFFSFAKFVLFVWIDFLEKKIFSESPKIFGMWFLCIVWVERNEKAIFRLRRNPTQKSFFHQLHPFDALFGIFGLIILIKSLFFNKYKIFYKN